MTDEPVLSETESICPECLTRIPASRVLRGEDVILRKTCPEHGTFETPVWRGNPSSLFWTSPRLPSHPESPSTSIERGCPWDCGLCPEHRQHTCTVLLEVTRRCNLNCSFCFADAHGAPDPHRHHVPDPDIGVIKGWYERAMAAGGPYNIQLSGGEPTLRDDLPDIIALGRLVGFPFIQVNTNGLRLAQDPAYVKRLGDAGLASVFLQFDGVTDEIYSKLRGRALFEIKETAIRRCAEHGIGVILVPTLVPGVNIHEIGAVIEFALKRLPAVRGVHFQPVSYFGRVPSRSASPPAEGDRITIPEILREIEAQTDGRIKATAFKPPGCENALCSFHGNFILLPDGDIKAWTRHAGESSCCKPERTEKAEKGAARARRFVTQFWAAPSGKMPEMEQSKPRLGEWDLFVERARTHSLCISGMAFQDAWNLDLERLRDCCIHVMHPDGRLVPFCAYNVTDVHGRSFYRGTLERQCMGPSSSGVKPAEHPSR